MSLPKTKFKKDYLIFDKQEILQLNILKCPFQNLNLHKVKFFSEKIIICLKTVCQWEKMGFRNYCKAVMVGHY